MAYYMMINGSLTKAQIDAGGLDPGSIYVANDSKEYITFTNDDGTPRQVGVVSDTGTDVVEAPTEISAASLVEYTMTSTVNNFNGTGFDKAVILMVTNNSGTLDWTGFTPPGGIRRFTFFNRGPDNIRLKHLNAGSTAGNKIYNPGAAVNFTITGGESKDFLYDTTNSRWIVL